jgi:PAS domain S-box-containing protein
MLRRDYHIVIRIHPLHPGSLIITTGRFFKLQGSELLAEIALGLVGQGSFDDRMNHALQSMGRYLGVSRAYIFLDTPDGSASNNTHEWCAQGIKSQRDHLQGVEYSTIPSWRGMLALQGRILASDIAQLPMDIAVSLAPQGIHSILVMPLHIRNKITGFIGFDQCGGNRGWDVEELSILRTISGIVSTVLERDADRKLLADSEANFRQFFNTIDDLIVVADADARLVYANDAVSRILGYSAEELKNMPLLEMHPVERRDEAKRIIDEMLRGDRDTCPLELVCKDGTNIPVETRVWFGRWDGKDCLFGLSKDLSEKEAQLQMLARLFNENPMPMALSDISDNRFIDINDAFIEKLGYSRVEIVGKTSNELGLFVNPSQRRHLSQLLLQEGRLREAEVQVRRKDGKVLEGLFSGGIVDNQGSKNLLTVMIDITEQVELRDRLEYQRRRLKNIIDSTRLGTWEWDILSGQTVFNERWASMLGYGLVELEPTSIETWKQLIVPDDFALSETLLSKHFAGETDYYEFEGRMRPKDGHLVWIQDKGKVIERDKNGTPSRMFGTHQDISDRKAMEERLKDMSTKKR